MINLPSKDSAAAKLANSHFDIESGMLRIFRLIGPEESNPTEPIKLLEVNKNTIAVGIDPLYFGSHSGSGIFYPSVIVEITPDEFEQLMAGKLRLPDDWTMGQEYHKAG
jgi:AMMECR1 domain-containing protein